MAVYSYIGLDAAGQERRGQLEAESPKEVAAILRGQSIFLIKAREGELLTGGGNFTGRLRRAGELLRPGRYLPVTQADLVVLFRQLSLMLRAGFTLVGALEACQALQTKIALRGAVRRIGEKLRQGTSFSASLAKEKKLFTPMTTNLIASGERSGNLDAILDRLAENMERSKELKRQLVTAMFYPCFVLAASVAVVVLMMVYVVPRFAAFLTSRRAELPESTRMLMNASDWTLHWGVFIAGGLGAAVFLILAAYTTKPGKRVVDQVILALPVIGKAVVLGAMSQAGWNLAMLLKSGVTALESLRITGGVLANVAVGQCFQRAADGLLVGRPLSKTLEQPHIPLMMRHMASVGEKSGQLDRVMDDVGAYYQKELVAKMKFMTAMVEPMLILFAGGIVFFVYYSLFKAVMAVSTGGM